MATDMEEDGYSRSQEKVDDKDNHRQSEHVNRVVDQKSVPLRDESSASRVSDSQGNPATQCVI
ncbi:hypothetical protein A2U01_0100235, partial [Trifolium medium]|nr:hypothetical protein [Trifolium medium]